MPTDQPSVLTDHALIRYMERVLELDLESIRAEILSPRNLALIKVMKSCRIPAGKGCDLVVVSGRIVSVAPRPPRPGDPKQKKRK
jgi:hypothetical protein